MNIKKGNTDAHKVHCLITKHKDVTHVSKKEGYIPQ